MIASFGSVGLVRAGEEASVGSGGVRKLDSLLGRDVSTQPEGDTGRVVDVLIDADGRVSAAVVEFGGFLGIGTRKIAVDWEAFRVINGGLVVDVTREQLRRAREYKASEPAGIVKSVRN
jgi:hypothetical protein